MNNDPLYDRLRQSSWRRKLTAAEQAEMRVWLEAHPEAQAEWEAEAGLNDAMGRLRDVPVPSNFAARVLQAAEREEARGQRRQRSTRFWQGFSRWLPRTAIAALVVGVAVVGYRYSENGRRQQMAASVATISHVASLPSPDILEDFDAIRAMPPTPAPDEQLLTLFE
jgi:negative regulator of sigma E activity